MTIQLLTGYRIGQYEIQEFLGAGSMGTVYRGVQANLKREVAIKILPDALITEQTALTRFMREAEIVARLEHPHIVPIYDYGIRSSTAYIVMRMLTGGTLASHLKPALQQNSLLPLPDVVSLLRQLASALDYAHSQRVVHRDVKPSNVMFDSQGFAFLTDFGLAKLLHDGHSLTGSNGILGTPAYMAPEQWRSEAVCPATDQYSLGVMAYYLVTGRLPFDAPTPYGLMRKHLYEEPIRPHELREHLPVPISVVLQKALAKDPSDRYKTVSEFAEAFAQAIPEGAGLTQKLLIPGQALTLRNSDTLVLPDETELLPVAFEKTQSLPPRKRRPFALLLPFGILLLIVGTLFLALRGNGIVLGAMTSPTATATLTETVTPTPTATYTSTSTPTSTATPTDTLTNTSTSTSTKRPVIRATRTPHPATSVPQNSGQSTGQNTGAGSSGSNQPTSAPTSPPSSGGGSNPVATVVSGVGDVIPKLP